ncbi:MAG: hypothetical protein ACYT04_37990 [Nostoc sp.]
MTHCDQLRPWAIFQHPREKEKKAICVYRFRTRSDADAYMSILRQGGGKFEVLYDRVAEIPQPQP